MYGAFDSKSPLVSREALEKGFLSSKRVGNVYYSPGREEEFCGDGSKHCHLGEEDQNHDPGPGKACFLCGTLYCIY